MLGVLGGFIAVAFAESVIELCLDKAVADGNRVKFIAADSPVEQLLAPRSRIERPAACRA